MYVLRGGPFDGQTYICLVDGIESLAMPGKVTHYEMREPGYTAAIRKVEVYRRCIVDGDKIAYVHESAIHVIKEVPK